MREFCGATHRACTTDQMQALQHGLIAWPPWICCSLMESSLLACTDVASTDVARVLGKYGK